MSAMPDLGPYLLWPVIFAVFGFLAWQRERHQQKLIELVTMTGDELRRLIRAGAWDDFEAREREAWSDSEALRGRDARRTATVLSLARSEYGIARGRPELVREGAEAALANAAGLPARERTEFELQARALAGIGLDPAVPEPDLLRLGGEALARAGEANGERTRSLIVQAAVQVARALRVSGDREAAEAAAAQALELARQPDLDEAPLLASVAASEAAQARLDAGEDDEAGRWFDRAEEAVRQDRSPAGRRHRGFVLLVRALRMPGDPLLDAGVRRARLEGACEAARGLDWDDGPQIFARACHELGQMDGDAGEHARAAGRFAAAVEGLAGRTDPESVQARLHNRIACGHARLAAEDLGAAGEYQLAMDEAAAREEPELRALALPAAFALAGMLISSGMLTHAGEVLDRASQVAEGSPEGVRALRLARVEFERAALDRQSGELDRARDRLRAVLAAASGEGEDAGHLRRAALYQLGRAALSTGEAAEAAERFAAALDEAWDEEPADDAQRAEVEWHLATAHVQLARGAAARGWYERAFERGRASGLRQGRFAAAQSALQLAEHADLVAEQRRWYEAAVALASLCGSGDGEALARHAEKRMRARAAGED